MLPTLYTWLAFSAKIIATERCVYSARPWHCRPPHSQRCLLTSLILRRAFGVVGIYPAERQGYLSASVVAGVKMRCFAVSATLTTTVLPSPLDTSSCSCRSGCNWRLAVGSSPRGGLALYIHDSNCVMCEHPHNPGGICLRLKRTGSRQGLREV